MLDLTFSNEELKRHDAKKKMVTNIDNFCSLTIEETCQMKKKGVLYRWSTDQRMPIYNVLIASKLIVPKSFFQDYLEKAWTTNCHC